MGVYIGEPIIISDMQGPCPKGFHVPLSSERQAVYNVWTALGGGSSDGTNFGIALKLPFAGFRNFSTATVAQQGSRGLYWSSSKYDDTNYAYNMSFGSNVITPQGPATYSTGCAIRCFKNSPVIPTSSWTKLYGTSIESGGIFWDGSKGLISLSSDGQTWVTIADKNIGATNVYNDGDGLNENNCGYYFQRGNNYGFPRTGGVTTSGSQVNASEYGPGNYYNSNIFITANPRDNSGNNNLRGGVSQGTSTKPIELKNAYIGEYRVPGANTMFYIPFNSDSLDHSGNGVATSGGGTITYQNPGALITDSFYANYTQNPSSFTVSVWCKSPNSSGEKGIIQQAYIVVGSYNGWDLIFQDNSIRVEFLKPSENIVWQQAVSNVGVTNWHLVTLTVDNGTTGNVYIDGELKMTHSVSGYNPYQIAYQMGKASTNTYLGDVILEDRCRTAEQVAGYYNQTKSLYGIS